MEIHDAERLGNGSSVRFVPDSLCSGVWRKNAKHEKSDKAGELPESDLPW